MCYSTVAQCLIVSGCAGMQWEQQKLLQCASTPMQQDNACHAGNIQQKLQLPAGLSAGDIARLGCTGPESAALSDHWEAAQPELCSTAVAAAQGCPPAAGLHGRLLWSPAVCKLAALPSCAAGTRGALHHQGLPAYANTSSFQLGSVRVRREEF